MPKVSKVTNVAEVRILRITKYNRRKDDKVAFYARVGRKKDAKRSGFKNDR